MIPIPLSHSVAKRLHILPRTQTEERQTRFDVMATQQTLHIQSHLQGTCTELDIYQRAA